MKSVRGFIQQAIKNCNFKNAPEKYETYYRDNWLVLCLEESMKEYGIKIINMCLEVTANTINDPKLISELKSIKEKIK